MKLQLGNEAQLQDRRKHIHNNAVEEVLRELDTLPILGDIACYNSPYYQYVDVKRFDNAYKQTQGILPLGLHKSEDSVLAVRLAKKQRQLINRYREVLTLYAELSLHKGGKVVSVTELEAEDYDSLEQTSLLRVERYATDGKIETVIVPEFYFDKVREGCILTPRNINLHRAFTLAEYWYSITIHRLEQESITLKELRVV